jgi:hypothetical protein
MIINDRFGVDAVKRCAQNELCSIKEMYYEVVRKNSHVTWPVFLAGCLKNYLKCLISFVKTKVSSSLTPKQPYSANGCLNTNENLNRTLAERKR